MPRSSATRRTTFFGPATAVAAAARTAARERTRRGMRGLRGSTPWGGWFTWHTLAESPSRRPERSPMNRREFVTSAAASAAVLSSGPLLLGMTRKAETPNPVIGTGEHTYECVHNWGELPPDYAWQTTHNVALDS